MAGSTAHRSAPWAASSSQRMGAVAYVEWARGEVIAPRGVRGSSDRRLSQSPANRLDRPGFIEGAEPAKNGQTLPLRTLRLCVRRLWLRPKAAPSLCVRLLRFTAVGRASRGDSRRFAQCGTGFQPVHGAQVANLCHTLAAANGPSQISVVDELLEAINPLKKGTGTSQKGLH